MQTLFRNVVSDRVVRAELTRRHTWGRRPALTLGQLVFRDPDFFFWAEDVGLFDRSGIGEVARLVGHLARRIRVRDGLVADYVLDRLGRFVRLEITSAACPPGGTRRNHIDLSVPHTLWKYDKGGSRVLVATAKEHLFGSRSYRLTPDRCTQFFVDASNFLA